MIKIVPDSNRSLLKFITLMACAMLLSSFSRGQLPVKLQSLVDAEKQFAKLSIDKSTRQAFSTFLGDSSIIFQPGPVNGKKFWQQAKEGTEMLSWKPVFAGIAAAGDMGYTTGPWEFRKNRSDTIVTAMGYFVSVWKKEKEEWKVALDIGISFPVTSQREDVNFPDANGDVFQSEPAGNPKQEMLNRENDFITMQNKAGWDAYPDFISKSTRIYRPGSFPSVTEEARVQLFSDAAKKFSYSPIDAAVSASGDLGYVYGKALIEITKADSTQKLDGNYLRIWRKEKGKGWKIVLDLVNIAR